MRKKMTCTGIGAGSVTLSTVAGSEGKDAELPVSHIAVLCTTTPSDFWVSGKQYEVIIRR
jgi:hypothetical protein